MHKQTYTSFITAQIYKYDVGCPILLKQLGEALGEAFSLDETKAYAATAVAIKRILDNGAIPMLRCFGKGVYYLTKKTVFGETGIDKEKLIAIKYLNGGNGYETGVSVMHKIGLTSMMPAERAFVSNRAPSRTKRDDALGIIVQAPKARITMENRSYLQLLDLLNAYDDVPIDADSPYALLGEFVRQNGLEYGTLLNLASRHYNNQTILRLARVAETQGGTV